MNRRRWILPVAFALLTSSVAVSYARLRSERHALELAALDLAACEAMTARLESLHSRPQTVKSEEIRFRDLSERIETTARSSGIPVERLVRIDPRLAHRLDNGPYLEKTTEIEFDRVELHALTTCLHALSEGSEGLTVKTLRLQAPHGEEVGRSWRAECTLSYLIYSPQEGGSGGAR